MALATESFSAVLNDFLARHGMTEREFLSRVPDLHPTTFAELRRGLDECDSVTLRRIVAGHRLDRDWASRFYTALLVQRDGEDLVRAAGLVE
jgi:hypothetical protein